MNEVKKWVPELQSLSGLAIIFVVLIHATSYYLFNVLHMSSFEKVDYATRLVDNLVHGAVPMFIFIAGYKYALNDMDIPYIKFVRKRVSRVIKPFLVISIVFFTKDIIVNADYNNMSNLCKSFFRIFIGYNIAYQLWYVPLYILISLVYPILCKIIKSEKIRSLFIVSVIILQYSLSWYSDSLAGHPFDFVYYLIYFHIGVIVCKYDIKSRFKEYDIIIILTYALITLVLTFNTIEYISGPLKKFIIWPMSVIAYYFLIARIKDNKMLQYLGKYSFYIFLLHEPLICTDISVVFNSIGIYYSVAESFAVGILTVILTLLLYKIIESTFIKKLIF